MTVVITAQKPAFPGAQLSKAQFGDPVVNDLNALATEVNGVWTDYSAAFALTASTTNPTKGNSTYVARYSKVGRTVHVVYYISIGSTFTAGSGTYYLSLPVPAAMSILADGTAHLLDGGVAHYVGVIEVFDANRAIIYKHGDGGTLGSAGPGTPWASGDYIRATLEYETAN